MVIAGLDLASRLTGWCAGDGETLPDVGAWPFPQCDDDLGWMLEVLDDYLAVMIERFAPEAIVFEAPILIVNRRGREAGRYTDTPAKLRKLYNLGGHVEFVCRKRGIECSEVSVQDIKREVTGNALAEKDDLVAVARRCGIDLPAGPGAKDAADAWGAWLLALRRYVPLSSRRFDALIWGRRGALI